MTIPRFPVLILSIAILAITLSSCGHVPDHDPARIPVQTRSTDHVAIAFYNCENFFDYHRQPGKQDEDFTPEGKYHYTQKIYEQKLHNIATVLQGMSSSANGDLAFAGLAEIENDGVLDDLCKQPELGNSHMRHICHNGPDPRGINTGFIYDPSLFTLIREETIPVVFASGGRSRDILHVYGVLDGDTVHVLVNHWTSRRNQESESDVKRMTAATTARSAIDHILEKKPGTRIVVMGDFNDNPTDPSIREGLNAQADPKSVNDGQLYDPFTNIYLDGRGTEKFGKEWNLFDQVMLSAAWVKGAGGHLSIDHADIYSPDFITDHKRNGDITPRRAFKGSHWENGYSDHFPVVISFQKR